LQISKGLKKILSAEVCIISRWRSLKNFGKLSAGPRRRPSPALARRAPHSVGRSRRKVGTAILPSEYVVYPPSELPYRFANASPILATLDENPPTSASRTSRSPFALRITMVPRGKSGAGLTVMSPSFASIITPFRVIRTTRTTVSVQPPIVLGLRFAAGCPATPHRPRRPGNRAAAVLAGGRRLPPSAAARESVMPHRRHHAG
jgi:hypothetical protein